MSSTVRQSRYLSVGDEFFEAVRSYFRDRGSQPDTVQAPDVELALFQLQKLATLGQLASEIAHDFGNLMTIMLGYSELLIAAAEQGQRSERDHLDELHRAAERASALTTRLLGYCRKSLDEPCVLDLAMTVSDLSTLLARLIGSAARLDFAIDRSAGNIVADAKQVEQLVTNLVLNARDAVPIGGKIMVEVARTRVESPMIHALGIASTGDYVRLRVRDNGCGMTADSIAHLFRPFFTTKAGGTGLGLTIVARIARRCQAAITIESRPGAGTTFDVHFPLAQLQ